MRLTSSEVKPLLARGQRSNAAANGIVLASRTLARQIVVAVDENYAVTGTKPSDHAGGARVALAVPKRQLKRAVDRNRVKRILRETFRQHQVRDAGIDILVTLNGVPKLVAASTVKREVRKSIQRAATALYTKLAESIGSR